MIAASARCAEVWDCVHLNLPQEFLVEAVWSARLFPSPERNPITVRMARPFAFIPVAVAQRFDLGHACHCRKVRPMTTWKERARALKQDVIAIALALRDPRVPWYAKAVGACVVAYALSPIDLIPDFIPVLGYLDDLVLVPIGIALMLRLVPPGILAEHRAAAANVGERRVRRAGAAAVIAIWAAALGLAA